MTLAELIAAFRLESDDRVTPYLWSDAEIAGYLAEAENEACIRARLLFDETTIGVASLAVVSGQSWLTLHPSILRVLRARLAAGSCPLALTSPDELDRMSSDWENQTGTPRMFYVAGSKLRLIPQPDATDTLYLNVFRAPLVRLDSGYLTGEPEIAEPHHAGLLRWALYRGYSKRDEDAFDPGRAQIALQQFEREFGPRPSARAIRQHLDGRPHSVRAIGF